VAEEKSFFFPENNDCLSYLIKFVLDLKLCQIHLVILKLNDVVVQSLSTKVVALNPAQG
jgi:hypothetical protein